MRIPLACPDLQGREEELALEAIRSSFISSRGPFVERFEHDFARSCGVADSVTVCNGTAALHLTMAALGLESAAEVLIPSLTYVATANAVRYLGAEPVFVDVDPANGCLDPLLLETAITPRTRGIVAVHLYGHPADMDAIGEIAARHRLWVLEDAAEAHFATYKGRPVGSLAKAATFSFYGNKLITCGEGGAITTDDPAFAARLRLLRGQAMDPVRRYHFLEVGYNYRLTNVACALLCAQLERAPQILGVRQRIFASYRKALAGIPGIGFPPASPWASPAPWLFSITVDAGVYGRTRDELASALERHGIETRPFFVPLHRLPAFRDAAAARAGSFAVAERLAESGMNLPTYSALTDEQIAEIGEKVRTLRGGASPSAGTRFQRLTPVWADSLGELFHALRDGGDEPHFHPHPLTKEEAVRRCCYAGEDLYFVAIENDRAVGYGLLRGWDEGYETPSLGIALHPSVRGRRLGRSFIEFLHGAAKRRGARSVRVKVSPSNVASLTNFERLGYRFHGEEAGQLVGSIELG